MMSHRLKPLCIETVNMHFIIILVNVQSLEVLITYTSQTTQIQIPIPTQILVLHTNFLQATITTLPSPNTQALLAGSYHFIPSEVEVFYLQ